MLQPEHTIFLTLLFLFIYLILYQQILKPLILLRFYRKQGIQCEFVPLTGSSMKDAVNVEERGDYYYGWLRKSLGAADGIGVRRGMFAKNVGSVCAVVVTEPKLVQEMFMNKEVFIKHPFQNALIKRLSPYGLVLLQGDTWKKHRKVISKGFQYTVIDRLLQKVDLISDNFIQKLKKQNIKTIPNVFNFFKQAAGNIISLVYFQQDIASLQVQGKSLPVFLSDLIADLANQSYSWRYCIFGMNGVNLQIFAEHRRLLKNIYTIRQRIRFIVRKHKQIRKNNVKQGFSMWDNFFAELNGQPIFTQNQIIDQFITFFSDGIYTTGHFMMMLTYNLAKSPTWLSLLTNQLDQKLKNQPKSQSLINSLPILTSCSKQTLRLVPPVVTGIERVAVKDTTLSDGTKIMKDTMVMACHLVNHLDQRLHERAGEFWPGRWIDSGSRTVTTVRDLPGSFIPFSIGERHCPGQKFAMAESAIFMSKFLTNFKYSIIDQQKYELKFTQRFLREPLQPFSYRLQPFYI